VIEAILYLGYAIPMAVYVLWPQGMRPRRQRVPAGARVGAAENPA
jgi:hypothetical protein